MNADAIVVGAGLAGLVATAELVDAGKRVILVDQEPEASLGGQAFWSFGGLFLVDSPEQRRMRRQATRYDLAWQDWLGTAGFDRPEDLWPRALGRGLRRTSPPARSAPGCTSAACASSRSSAGPSAAATARSATATRSRASTSPGAPGRASSTPFVARVREGVERKASSSCASATASTSCRSPTARSTASAARCSRPRDVARGEAVLARRRRRLRPQRARRDRHLRRHRRQPRARRARTGPRGWASRRRR